MTAVACHGRRVFVAANYVRACCWQVPRLPAAGETLQAHHLSVEAGGKGLNVAVALNRLGLNVVPLIGIGNDEAGDALLALLALEGISQAHTHRFDQPSGWGAGLVGAEGNNAIAVYPGANLALRAEHVNRAQAEILSSALVYGQLECALEAVAGCFELAGRHGIATVLNPSPWPQDELPGALRRYSSCVIVNEVEAVQLLKLPIPLPTSRQQAAEHIATFLAAFWRDWPGARELVVTLGASGCLAYIRGSGQKPLESPAFSVSAVDTVGCGDAFAAGFCAARLDGFDLASTLQWANACGALCAQQRGVLGALPNRTRLMEWLEPRNGN